MNTNIKLATTDEDRAAIAATIGQKGLVSRKDINNLVKTYIRSLIAGGEDRADKSEKTEQNAEPMSAEPIEAGTPGGRNRSFSRDDSIREFVPSRGDEPYLYKPEDPELAAICSTVLDGLEFIERYTWDALNRNRA